MGRVRESQRLGLHTQELMRQIFCETQASPRIGHLCVLFILGSGHMHVLFILASGYLCVLFILGSRHLCVLFLYAQDSCVFCLLEPQDAFPTYAITSSDFRSYTDAAEVRPQVFPQPISNIVIYIANVHISSIRWFNQLLFCS